MTITNRLWRGAFGAASLLLLVAGCDQNFDPGSRIEKLRLLALRADQPFARPGESVELQLLAADVEQRPRQFAWSTCTDPASSTVDSCLDALDGPFEPFDPDAGPLTLTIPAGALTDRAGRARATALRGVAVAACPGKLGGGDTAGVPLVCERDGIRLPIHELDVGIKRIFVRETDRNANPEITRLTWDGEDWPEGDTKSAQACRQETNDIEDCAKSLRNRLGVETSEPESGIDDNGTPFREQLIVSYYASQGVFEREVRIGEDADNHWAAQRTGRQPEEASLWIVVRDDRGGVGWVERTVRVR